MRYLRPSRMWWHRFAVVERSLIAHTYGIVSFHTTRAGALTAALALVEHFDRTGNVAMLAGNEWEVKPAGVAQVLAKDHPVTAQPGIRYAR